MVLLTAIILIILGALFFALQGVFGRFSDNWEWVGIILAAVGIAIGTPPFLQMSFGRPKIIVTFETEDMEGFSYFICVIHNIPVGNRILRGLGVHREQAQDVTATYQIHEQGTMRLICPVTFVKIKTQTGIASERISLPTSYFPSKFVIIYFDKSKNEVWAFRQSQQLLVLGAYIATIEVFKGHDRYVMKRCNFIVGDKYPFVYWSVSRNRYGFSRLLKRHSSSFK